MLPPITGLPEVPDASSSARRVALMLVLLLLFVIVIFPFVRVADMARTFGIEPPAWEAETARYRGLLFLPCLLACVAALLRPMRQWLRGLERGTLPGALALAVLIYALLAVFAFPYPYPDGPYSDPSGLGGIGRWYGGEMAPAPFDMVAEIGYRRMLMPAIAYYLGLTEPAAYYVFSQLLSVCVIGLAILFMQARAPALRHWPLAARALLYLSVCSSSCVVYNSQLPGYPDILLFALLLLLLLVPMTTIERLTVITLAMITHEGALFGLVPLVLVAFPREQRRPALLLLAAYVALWVSSYGSRFVEGLAGHDVVGEASHRAAYLQHPIAALAGVFFAWKLLWLPAMAWLLAMARQPGWQPVAGALLIVFFPLGMLVIAWDTTRLAAFGFAGMLLVLAAAAQRWIGARPGTAVMATLALNLLIPANNVVIARPQTALSYEFPGLYRSIYPVLPGPRPPSSVPRR